MRLVSFMAGIVVATTFVASMGRADDRAVAEQAFQQGRQLMAEGKVAEACPKFAAAAQLSQTTGVRLNLADCYAKLGKLASAWAKAEEALTFAERAGDSAAATLARAQMAALKPILTYLTVSVTDASAVQAMEVTIDGEKLPAAVWGTPFPVDAGEHEVTARAPGYGPYSTRVTVPAVAPGAAGERSKGLVVSVPALVPDPTTVPHASVTREQTPGRGAGPR